jgi:hypothetical protein
MTPMFHIEEESVEEVVVGELVLIIPAATAQEITRIMAYKQKNKKVNVKKKYPITKTKLIGHYQKTFDML